MTHHTLEQLLAALVRNSAEFTERNIAAAINAKLCSPSGRILAGEAIYTEAHQSGGTWQYRMPKTQITKLMEE